MQERHVGSGVDFWRLLEKGEPFRFVATKAMSVESIAKSVSAGLLLPHHVPEERPQLVYRNRIFNHGRLLYRVTFQENPDQFLDLEFRNRYLKKWGKLMEYDITSRDYNVYTAAEEAVMDGLERITGIKVDDPEGIISLGEIYAPDLTRAFVEDSDYPFDAKDAIEKATVRLKTDLDLLGYDGKGIEQLLSGILQLRGGVMYFSKELLNYPYRPGEELEDELLITPATPLPWSVVAGIELLSDADKQLMQQLLK